MTLTSLLIGGIILCLLLSVRRCQHCKKNYFLFSSKSRWSFLFCSVDCEFCGYLSELMKLGVDEIEARKLLQPKYPHHYYSAPPDQEIVIDKFGTRYYRSKQRVKP